MLMSDQRWRKRFLGDRPLAPETLMMGYGYDPFLSERSLKPPVFHTSTFVFRTAQDGKAFFELAYGLRQKRPNEEPGLIYSRINNPDLEMLEDRLTVWDEAEANLTFASGMAAISTTLWAYARPGTVIIHSGPVYGGTDFLLKKIGDRVLGRRVEQLARLCLREGEGRALVAIDRRPLDLAD